MRAASLSRCKRPDFCFPNLHLYCGNNACLEPLPDITVELSGLTDRVIAYRVITQMEREGNLPPLIEIKGLGAIVADAKKGIAGVRAETAGLSTDAKALVAAVQDVRVQIKQAHEDLKFEAETLGNGGETSSGETSETSAGS